MARTKAPALEDFIGKYIEALCPVPAISCCHNGRVYSLAGIVERVAVMRCNGREGLVIEGTDVVVFPNEVRCKALHWTGESYKARSLRR
jgi:hypothetical protein